MKRINDACVLDWVTTLSPTMLLNPRVSFSRYLASNDALVDKNFDMTSPGFPASLEVFQIGKPGVEVRKYSVRPLRCQLFQGILVVQTSEHGLCLGAALLGNLVRAFRGRGRRVKRHWNAWPKTLVWAAVIVMRDPLKKRAFQMVLGKRND